MAQNVSLNLNDLKNAVNIIDHAAGQGAFKGWETIRQVMEIRDKFALFLQSAEAAEAAKSQETSQTQPVPESAIIYEDENEEEVKTKKKSSRK